MEPPYITRYDLPWRYERNHSSATPWIPNWRSRRSINNHGPRCRRRLINPVSTEQSHVHCLLQVTCRCTPLLLPSPCYGTDGTPTVCVATSHCCPRRLVTGCEPLFPIAWTGTVSSTRSTASYSLECYLSKSELHVSSNLGPDFYLCL